MPVIFLTHYSISVKTIVTVTNDFRTVAIDMRGYGDSDKPEKKSNYKMHILVEDIRQVVLALGKSFGELCFMFGLLCDLMIS